MPHSQPWLRETTSLSNSVLNVCYCFLLFAFLSLPLSLVVQTLPGQPVAMPRQNHQATGGNSTGDAGGRNAQDHVRLGTLRK